MGSLLSDIEILIAENLFEEAERRLIHHLQEYPRDQEAIALLAKVEKQLYLEKVAEVRIPSPQEALDELKRIARVDAGLFQEEKENLLAWLETVPPEMVMDVCIMLGLSGWVDVSSEFLEKQFQTMKSPTVRAEASAWIARFLMESHQPIRARQWAEKAVSLTTGLKDAEGRKLSKELRVLYCRCLWEAGERQQALARLTTLSQEYKEDQELKWLLENYAREL